MSTLFDPLDTLEDEAPEVLVGARKREIGNILKSYVGFYDPFSELVQNAMDATDERERALGRDGYQKRLWIQVDLKNNQFSVTDNGIGFSENNFRRFLAPSITFNKSSATRGQKGVGATYLAYGFEFLQLGTKTPEYTEIAEFTRGRSWVDDPHSSVSRPTVAKSNLIHTAFNVVDRGSTFTLRLSGASSRPSDLSWIGATTAEQWMTLLRIKTPLGHVNIGNIPTTPICCELQVIDREGNTTTTTEKAVEYLHPHQKLSASVDLNDVVDWQKAQIAKGADASKLPGKFTHLNGIYRFWNEAETLTLIEGRPKLLELAKKLKVTAYAYFCYSVRVWDQFNDTIVKLRKGRRVLRGGLQLATNHMAQGDLIAIPLTSNIGYQNQVHAVVHFEGAEPDLGRKGFQPEVKELGEQIATAAVGQLKKWRRILKRDTGAAPAIASEGDLHEWIKQQEKHEESSPLVINNPNFFLPMQRVSLTAVPVSEQDVIALFHQLLAGGVVRGVRVMATSQSQQYDGIFRFFVNEPLANHKFDKETNPLGVMELQHASDYCSRPYVLEYKHNLNALISDFENGEKNESDVNLAVAWEIGDEWKKRFEITSLLDLDNLQHREFHGVTHIFLDGNSGDRRFYGVILNELIDYLNDVDAVQARQKADYGETI